MPFISKFYLLDATSPNTGTMPSNSPATMAGGVLGAGTEATGATTARDATDTIGTSNPDIESSITSAATSGANQRLGHRRFVSRPLAAQTFAAADGNWTFSFARSESNTNHNGRIFCYIYPWRPSAGTEVGTIGAGDSCQLNGAIMAATAETAESGALPWVGTTAILDGDILVFDVFTFFNQAMATAYTDQFAYNGTTEASATTCASFVTPPAPLELSQVGYRAQPFQVSFRKPIPSIIVPQRDTIETTPGPSTYDPTQDSAYDQIVLGDLPAYGAYWKMNEKSGTTFADRGPNDLDLGLTNVTPNQYPGPDARDPVLNTSALFGATSKATAPTYDFAFPDRSPFSLEIWFYPFDSSSWSTGRQWFFTKAIPGNGYEFYADKSGQIFFNRIRSGVADQAATSATVSVVPDLWNHLVAVYDGLLLYIYLNGALVANSGSGDALLPSSDSSPLVIGGEIVDIGGAIGYLAKAAVYSTALTDVEVLNHFQAGTSSTWSPDQLAPGMRLPVSIPARRFLPIQFFDLTVPTFPVAQTFSVFFEGIQALADTSSEPIEAEQSLAATKSDPWEAIVGGIQQTKSDPFEANLGVKQTNVEPYDAIGGIAGTKSDPWEAIQSIAATKSDPWEALVAIAKTASDVWEANQGIAGTKPDPWEALQTIASTKSDAWEALVALTTTKSEAWEALVAITKTNSEAWESLTAIASTKSEVWEALLAIVSTKSEAWEALVGIAKTNSESWEALRGIASTKSDAWEALQKLAASGLTPWEAIVGGIVATRVNSWEALLGVAATKQDTYEALGGIASSRSDVWDATGAVRSTSVSPWEAIIGGIVSTRLNPWEANLAIASSKAEAWEALLGISSTTSAPWESTGNVLVTQTASLPWDSLKAIAATSTDSWEATVSIASSKAEAWEALLGIASTRSDPYDALQMIAATKLDPYETLQALVSAKSAPYEALKTLSATSLAAWDALRGVATSSSAPWEAQGHILVTQTAELPWDALKAIASSASDPLDAIIGGIRSTRTTPYEALLGVAATNPEIYESLRAIRALAVSPWDATGIVYIAVSATGQLPYDATGGIRAVPSLPLEVSKNLTKTAPGPYEAQIKVLKSGSSSYETLIGIRNPSQLPLETVIAAIAKLEILPWEATGRAKIITTETGLQLDGAYHSPNFERVVVPIGGTFVILAVPSELMEGLTETGLDIGET